MKTKDLVLTALFIALCFVGANIKVMGTIAFDSAPAFLGALLLGPVYGGIIGASGHFLTALISGFPLSLPVHLITMAIMALTMVVFTLIYKLFLNTSKLLAATLSIICGALVNGPLALLILTPLLIPVMGKTGIMALVPILSGVAALNALIAVIVYRFLPGSIKVYENK